MIYPIAYSIYLRGTIVQIGIQDWHHTTQLVPPNMLLIGTQKVRKELVALISFNLVSEAVSMHTSRKPKLV